MATALRDEALVSMLWETHGAALLAYATRVTGNRVAAEDAVHRALVRAWKQVNDLPTGKLAQRTWLLAAVQERKAPARIFQFPVRRRTASVA